MLLTARRWRVSFSGSLLLLGFTFGLFCVSASALLSKPWTAGTVFCALLGAGLFLFIVGRFRLASVNARGRIFVRTLFGKDGVDSKRCAFGIAASVGSKGTTYTVFATDGTARAEFAEYETQRGAERGRHRLEDCFGIDVHEVERQTAKSRADGEWQRFEASSAAAKSHVDAYYASGAFRRAAYLAVGVVVLYVIGMYLFAWLTGTRL